MTKYDEYNVIKNRIVAQGGTVGPFKEINYGIQFEITDSHQTAKVRIYESKKKGVTVDLSQVKNEALKALVLNINSSEPSIAAETGLESDRFESALIGVDESGKGDYFGPLVIGAVYGDAETKQKLMQLGVADSKKLSDLQIAKLAATIHELCACEVIVVHNEAYNKLYAKIQNLNVLLARGHAKIIETLAKRTGCTLALSDQFGNEKLIQQELLKYALDLKLEQRPKAESNVIVAAASIIARDAFVQEMKNLSEEYGQDFPKGAGGQTLHAGRMFVQSFGAARLQSVAKLHFKTTEQLQK